MMVYHIDRGGFLCEGMVLSLSAEGLSLHGQHYWRSPSVKNPDDVNDFFIEHIFEEIRLAHYPDRPSRFQSLFGCPTMKQLRYWEKLFQEAGNPPVWQIETPAVWLADARLLHCMENGMYNLARARSNAHQYWQAAVKCDSPAQSCACQEACDCPSVEALIALPARVHCRF